MKNPALAFQIRILDFDKSNRIASIRHMHSYVVREPNLPKCLFIKP